MPSSALLPPCDAGLPSSRLLARRGLAGLALAALLGLSACAPQYPGYGPVGIAPPIGIAPGAPAQRAALLLPLSGPQAQLGQAMMNAGTLALFDEAPTGVEFAPRDTGGTPAGAAAAARAAIAEGARALVGPLTSAEAAAVAPVARSAGVPLLAFTNDEQRAGQGVWVLGTTPQQQVRRLVAAAARDGAQRFGLAAQNTEFGRALAAALRGATADLGLPQPRLALHPATAEPGMAAGGARAQMRDVDALLIGESGERARRFAAAFAGLSEAMPPPAADPAAPDAPIPDTAEPPPGPRLLGTTLWLNDGALRGEPSLGGAWFPGPDARARARFESRYREAFQESPPRVAAAAYDAAALAARALRSGSSVDSLTASQSFSGAEGPVRLLPGGQTLRGLAIYALSPSGDPLLLEPAADPAGPGF
ncbi:MAG TPA: ABC transporter substrate-binding protein [Falsiroseomonas sp.]|nr:ABC transporter substrate-binding protein [Falsiroseomonas sp.]